MHTSGVHSATKVIEIISHPAADLDLAGGPLWLPAVPPMPMAPPKINHSRIEVGSTVSAPGSPSLPRAPCTAMFARMRPASKMGQLSVGPIDQKWLAPVAKAARLRLSNPSEPVKDRLGNKSAAERRAPLRNYGPPRRAGRRGCCADPPGMRQGPHRPPRWTVACRRSGRLPNSHRSRSGTGTRGG
jgi:hypothetical protein